MSTIKTSELTGPALDWAVAVADNDLGEDGGQVYIEADDLTGDCELYWTGYDGGERLTYSPAHDWELAGPIIEREQIGLISPSNKLTMFWTADIGFESKFTQFDHDPLIAAMRCYCCSKLGNVVDIPEELCQQQSS